LRIQVNAGSGRCHVQRLEGSQAISPTPVVAPNSTIWMSSLMKKVDVARTNGVSRRSAPSHTIHGRTRSCPV
jgi:hypothetical protein